MTVCSVCGNRIEFRIIDGRSIPMHSGGGCSGRSGSAPGSRVVDREQSTCLRTNCPKCREEVYFIRHNGGSVWIDPPLGPPWDRHGCYPLQGAALKGKSASGDIPEFHPSLLHLANDGSLILTGVTIRAEVSASRRETILTLAIGAEANLVLMIRGGADILVGRICILDLENGNICVASEPDWSFKLLFWLSAPDATVALIKGRIQRLPPEDVKILAIAFAHSSLGQIDKDLRRLIGRFATEGVSGNFKPDQIIKLLPFAGEQHDRLIHQLCIGVMQHACRTNDVSRIHSVLSVIPETRWKPLLDWFTRYAPVYVYQSESGPRVRLHKRRPEGSEAWKIEQARLNPFWR